jgi:hypothetical protein
MTSRSKPISTTAPAIQPIGPLTVVAGEPVVDVALAGAAVSAGALAATADAGATSLALTASLALAAG